MKKITALLAMVLMAAFATAQKHDEKRETAAHEAVERQKKPAKPAANRITNGPVVEYITDKSAVVAWSTTAKSATVLMYGAGRNNLSQKAEARWGGTNHRVTIPNLQPSTTYYFKVESGQAQGSGTEADSQVGTFTTVTKGAAPKKERMNVGVK